MEAFKKIDDAYAVVITNTGVFKQVNLYKYDGLLYCKNGAGFIGLNADKSTTSKTIKWREVKGIKVKSSPFRIEVK